MNDWQEIGTVLARYCQLMNEQRYEEWGALLTDDVVFGLPNGAQLTGRDLVWQSFGKGGSSGGWKKHLILNPIIEVDGNEARVSADYLVLESTDDGRGGIRTVGRQVSRLVREDGAWRFAECTNDKL